MKDCEFINLWTTAIYLFIRQDNLVSSHTHLIFIQKKCSRFLCYGKILHNFPIPRDDEDKNVLLTLLVLIWELLWLFVRLIWPRKNVRRATIMKFMPPAKSVNLSNWKIAAIRKNISWITRIVMAEIAKWSSSNENISTAITENFNF